MKRLIKSLAVFVVVLLLSAQIALAATLKVTSIGGVSTGTGTLTSFTTTKTNPTMIGTATADATVDITIDDLTVAVTADTGGDWSYTPTSLAEGAHDVSIESNLETVAFTLTVDTDGSTSTSTSSATTSKGGVSTSSASLPEAGAVENTYLLIVAGMFLIGSGVVAHQFLSFPEEE